MGKPKLLLPLGGRTVVGRLLDVLRRPDIEATVVVVRPGEAALRAEACALGVTVVTPDAPPPDMRCSVEHALAEIRRKHKPRPDDGWLLVPADHPVLESRVVDELIDCWHRQEQLILVPTYRGRRGHPTLFAWSLTDRLSEIPPDRGINELLKIHAKATRELPVGDRSVLVDLDTPEQYEALRRRWESS